MTALPLLLALSLSAAPPQPLPSAADARRAAERSLPFLMKSSAAWREQRKCVTCHQVPFALWPAHEARARGIAVEAKALDGLTEWSLNFCATDKNKDQFTGGFLSTMVKTVLALEAAPKTEQTKKTFTFFVPLIARYQRADGSWKDGNFIGVKGAEREGIEVDTMWTVLGLNSLEAQLGKSLDADARATLKKCRQRGLDWLKDAKPATRSDWVMLRMLVEKQCGDAKKAQEWHKELLKRQNGDGGWAFTKGGKSHPLVTGECLYALSVMGTRGDEPEVRKAWAYLISTQGQDGSWKNISRVALGNGAPDKINAVTTHWGTGWAAIGLLRTLPAK
jgi:hypothetical protein